MGVSSVSEYVASLNEEQQRHICAFIEFMNTDAKERNKSDDPEKYSELIELKKLLDMGIITQEEFNQKKKQVLGL